MGLLYNWKVKIGTFLFKYRSFTPIPLIILVFIIFKPIDRGENNILLNLSGIFISLLGEFLRIISVGYSFKGTSGRETFLRADALNTTGIYSVVRNPLYIGNFLMFTGIVIVFSNFLALMIFSVFLFLQYYFIIQAEENYLKGEYGRSYNNYCSQVRQIIPTFKNYRKNQNPFNLKKVIFKENDSIFNMLVMFMLVLLYKERVFSARIDKPIIYIIPAGIFIVVYVLVKIIKKREFAKVHEES